MKSPCAPEDRNPLRTRVGGRARRGPQKSSTQTSLETPKGRVRLRGWGTCLGKALDTTLKENADRDGASRDGSQ
jgi:hypothetical protein